LVINPPKPTRGLVELSVFLSLYDYVVHICLHVAPKLRMQTPLHTLLIGCPYTFESKRYCCVIESAKFVFFFERDLMISEIIVKKT
jgi:hypothetical protein